MLYRLTIPFAKIALAIYFRKIYISNIDRLPKDKPVILAANHPTAFIEPCILACWLPRPLSYLARGDLYLNNWLIRKVYDLYRMVPIFRRIDAGYENLKNNYDTFEFCYRALNNQQAIMILSEGRTIHEKRLRPLMKGTARITFGAIEKYSDLDIHLVPVGVNYTDSDSFRSVAMIDIGEPMLASDYLKIYEDSPPKAVNRLTKDLSKNLRERIIHIDEEADDEWVDKVLKMRENEENITFPWAFSTSSGLLFDQKKIADQVNELPLEKKAEVAKLVNDYFESLKKNSVSDFGFITETSANFTNTFKLILGWLPQMLGWMLNILPIWLGNTLAKKIAPAIEFRAATAGVFSSILWLLWFAAIAISLLIWGEKWMFMLLLLVPALGYYHLIYRELARKWKAGRQVKNLNEKTKTELLRKRNVVRDVFQTAFEKRN